MNRRVLVIVMVIVGVVLAGAYVALNLTRPVPKPAEPAATVDRSAPQPAAKEERQPQPLPPKPAPRVARREPATPTPAPNAAVPPAPAPVEAAPEAGMLRIDSDVPGAQVFIDRVFIGAAPVTAFNVKPGTHRLNVSAEGYEGVAETLDVAAGARDVLIKLKEVRLDVKIAVIHKHRIGSCRGQLSATPRALRYETSNKDDGFSVPLLDLEGFQVDYLEKQLSVKLPKGKRFEFADPEGNPDRLFVFHRDVEKARDRLQKGDPAALK